MTDTNIRLPEAFLARVKKQLNDDFPAFLDIYTRPSRQALRVNTLKVSVQALQKLLPFLTEPVPGAEDGFFYPDDVRPGLSPYHEAGLYYIQEPSAMLAAKALAARPGERVLDLCAAPGGKTTAIAADMKGEGLLIANEIIPKRAAILSQNVERLGIVNAVVTNHAPAELSQRFPEFFDRILVDAPCSGEGMFKKEPQALEMWSPENVTLCAARQDGILAEADVMLKPGGRLVYSTCTFSPEEDEDCVSRFLAAHPDYTLLSRETLWPHRFPGEGQFIAVLEKLTPQGRFSKCHPDTSGTVLLCQTDTSGTVLSVRDDAPSSKKGRTKGKSSQPSRTHALPGAELISAWKDFSAGFLQGNSMANPAPDAAPHFGPAAPADPVPSFRPGPAAPADLDPARLLPFGDHLYLLPQKLDLTGLKVLRPGLHLGSMEKGRFEPSHSLALALASSQAANVLNLTEQQACDWITGLSIPCENVSGWCLVCVNGYSLGFGKVSGGQCKNHYPKGLRKKTVPLDTKGPSLYAPLGL